MLPTVVGLTLEGGNPSSYTKYSLRFPLLAAYRYTSVLSVGYIDTYQEVLVIAETRFCAATDHLHNILCIASTL